MLLKSLKSLDNASEIVSFLVGLRTYQLPVIPFYFMFKIDTDYFFSLNRDAVL